MLKTWPRCKTCGNLIQVSTGRCVECDLPNLCFGCITAEYRKEDPQPHPGGTKRYMGCECYCHEGGQQKRGGTP
jgi:hypothetical protein